MRVAQIVVDGAPEYERKAQRIDAAALVEAGHEIVAIHDAQIAHLYGPAEFAPSVIRSLSTPYVASGRPKQRWFGRVPEPRLIITPDVVPEAVDDAWFDALPARAATIGGGTRQHAIASYGSFRAGVHNMIQQTLARVHRFRDDIEWHVFNDPPQPRDLAGVEAWVDPAVEERDCDGFVAEALVSGLPVVASRTAINSRRAEKGINAFLVPARDPNELAHAILAALFKSEVAAVKIEGARRTASKFRSRQRLRVLERIYREALGS